eukprot:8264130-Alexandrium_andersonii.AAC.1
MSSTRTETLRASLGGEALETHGDHRRSQARFRTRTYTHPLARARDRHHANTQCWPALSCACATQAEMQP